jgi:signal transduction histidine kinase
VEVAAYRIAQEALTNVARHAGARHCATRLALVDGAMLLEISDDGQGLSPTRGRGVGLASMSERAEELGGSCLVESLPTGGTRVRATLPLTGDTSPHDEPRGESPTDSALVASMRDG